MLAGLGAGVGIGAGIWSGGSSEAAPLRGTAKPAVAKPKVERRENVKRAATYTDTFTLITRYQNLSFTPDYGPSNCAVPGEVKPTGWYAGGLGYIYKGTAEINASGSCWFEISYAYWKMDNGGRFGLAHANGSYSCDLNCTYYYQSNYFIYGG